MATSAPTNPPPVYTRVVIRVPTLCLALLAVSALAWLAVAPPARAAGTVTYEQRNYAVTIQNNGDVAIVEHWRVHFSGGPFHHAFLQLYLSRTSGIDFGTVSGANTGSQQAVNATDSAGNPLRQVSWDFPPTQDASRTFAIPYTIHGALGIGTGTAWFDWHYLDGGSSDHFTVASSTIAITVPAATPQGQLLVQASDTDNPPHMAVLSVTAVQASDTSLDASNPFEVMATFPRGELAASVQPQSWQDTDTPPTLPTSLGLNGNPPTGTGQPVYQPPTTSGNAPPGIFAFCLGAPCLLFIVLLMFGGGGMHYYGYRRGWWGGPYGGWWGGPWNNGGGGFGGGGGGFGGGGGMGGGGMGGGGMGGGGGAGGGGGGGGSGFG